MSPLWRAVHALQGTLARCPIADPHWVSTATHQVVDLAAVGLAGRRYFFKPDVSLVHRLPLVVGNRDGHGNSGGNRGAADDRTNGFHTRRELFEGRRRKAWKGVGDRSFSGEVRDGGLGSCKRPNGKER